MRLLALLFLILSVSCSSSPPPPPPGSASSRSALYESDDENCGAEGYACVGGRTCSDSRCLPAWIEMSTLNAPTPRGGAQASFLDGRYIVFGGCTTPVGTHTQAETSAAAYDPVNDSWSRYPSLNVGRADFASVLTDFGIYAVGGHSICYDGSERLTSIETMYPGSMAWVGADPGGSVPLYSLSLNHVFGMLLQTNGVSDAPLNDSFLLGVGSWSGVECNGFCGNYLDQTFTVGNTVKGWGGAYFDGPTRIWSSWSPPSGSEGKPAVGSADDGRYVYYFHSDRVTTYDKVGDGWLDDDESAVPIGLCEEGATAWTGSEMVVWSGLCDTFSSVGARYQPPAHTP